MANLSIVLSAPAPDESPYKTIVIPALDPTLYADGFRVYAARIPGSPRSDAWRLISGQLYLTTGVAVVDRYIKVGYFLNNPKYNVGYDVGGVMSEAIEASGSGSLGISTMGANFGSGAWHITDPKNGHWQIGDNIIIEEKDYIGGWISNLNDDIFEGILKFEYLNRGF